MSTTVPRCLPEAVEDEASAKCSIPHDLRVLSEHNRLLRDDGINQHMTHKLN
jgi:hypothetical protein